MLKKYLKPHVVTASIVEPASSSYSKELESLNSFFLSASATLPGTGLSYNKTVSPTNMNSDSGCSILPEKSHLGLADKTHFAGSPSDKSRLGEKSDLMSSAAVTSTQSNSLSLSANNISQSSSANAEKPHWKQQVINA